MPGVMGSSKKKAGKRKSDADLSASLTEHTDDVLKTQPKKIKLQDDTSEQAHSVKKRKKEELTSKDSDVLSKIEDATKKQTKPDSKKSKKKKKKDKSQLKDIDNTKEETPSEAVSNSSDQKSKKEKDEMKSPKKSKKKKKGKKGSIEDADTEKDESEEKPSVPVAKTEAVAYLERWKNERDKWNFQKVRQVWLLQHMYDDSMLDGDTFEILLEYLEGLKGNARSVTVTKAEEMINSVESDDESTDETPETESKQKKTTTEMASRARQVIQLLG